MAVTHFWAHSWTCMNLSTSNVLLSWVHKVLGWIFFLTLLYRKIFNILFPREILAPFFLMLEDHGTKWSLSILYNLEFFIVGVTLIPVLASRNAQAPKKKEKKKKKKRRGKKGKENENSYFTSFSLYLVARLQHCKLRSISLKTQHKSEMLRCCISGLRDQKLISLQL